MGEMLALTKKDIDFKRGIIRITKSFQRIKGEDLITDPKTPNSVRNVQMPDFLAEELKDYIGSLYGVDDGDRIFPITKSYLHHEMKRGCEASGVKKIRIHDLRHPYVKHTTKKYNSEKQKSYQDGFDSLGFPFLYLQLGFRVSPEEHEHINIAVALSGLTKQEYCYRRCLGRDIVVQGNPKVYKALKEQLALVLDELKRIDAGKGVDDELLENINLITRTLQGLNK